MEHITPDLREMEQFLYREAGLLDDRHFEEWLGLYTDDAYVWVPAGAEAREHHISLVDDDRELMEVRIRRLRHAEVHSQIPMTKAARLVSNVRIDHQEANGDWVVTSSFLMLESRLQEQRLFGGHYQHHLRWEVTGWKIAAKVVDLVNNDGVFSNLGLPF